MRRYPLDTQRLEAIFEVLGFDSSEVVFELEPAPVDPSWQKVRISQWQLTDISRSTGEHFVPSSGKRGLSSTFTVRMEIQRNSLFVVSLVVFPLTMIVVLSWSVFWMDRSSLGDRCDKLGSGRVR